MGQRCSEWQVIHAAIEREPTAMTTPKIYVRNSHQEDWKLVDIEDVQKIASSISVHAIGCTALTELKADAAKTVDVRGCTALTELKADAAKTVYASGCTALTELKADAAKTVDVRGCTALTELKADAAKTVDASGCTALTELKADAAEYVYASGCTALTELKADAAEYVYASGCTALTELKADAARCLAFNENGHELITDLRSWQEEMKEAEDIFRAANPQVGDWCSWIHHEVEFEQLSEPWQNRFRYVASQKSVDERAWRFRLMRPISAGAVREAIDKLKTAREAK